MSETSDRYRHVPLPSSWALLLEPYRVPAQIRDVELTIDPATAVQQIMQAPLGERDRRILFGRWMYDETLEVLGRELNLTRERVRQLETQTINTLLQSISAVQTFRTLCPQFGESHPFMAFQLALDSTMSDTQAPGARVVRVWQMLVELWNRSGELGKLCSYPVEGTQTWILSTESRESLTERIQKLPILRNHRFLTMESIAEALHVPTDLARWMLLATGEYWVTDLNTVGQYKWTIPELMEAIAHIWHEGGVRSWHASQIGAAMAIVHKHARHRKQYAGYNAHKTISILTRPELTETFQFAGKRGFWMLKERSDGQDSNQDAIVAVLKSSPHPMAVDDILPILHRSREISSATLYALLMREKALFNSLGARVFGLVGKKYKLDPTMIKWAIEQLQDGQVTEADMRQRALKAGLHAPAVIGTIQLDPRIKKWRKIYMLTETPA